MHLGLMCHSVWAVAYTSHSHLEIVYDALCEPFIHHFHSYEEWDFAAYNHYKRPKRKL